MNTKIFYALIALLCINSDVLSMMGPGNGSGDVLAELMATIAQRKKAKRIARGVTARRAAIADSSDSDDDSPSAHAPQLSDGAFAPAPSPARSRGTAPRPITKTAPARPAPPVPDDTSSDSDDDSDESDDESGYTSDVSDIEEVLPASVDQVEYSTGMFGGSITTPEGFIAHFQAQMDAQTPLDVAYQASVSQKLDTALLATAQTLTAHIAAQKDQSDIAARLAALNQMKSMIDQLNQLKSLAIYHTLIVGDGASRSAEQSARAYKRHIAATALFATQAVQAHDTALSNQWGVNYTLDRAAQLKRSSVGKAANTASLDAIMQKITADLGLATEGDEAVDPAAIIAQAQQLIKTLRVKRVPLNPHSVKALLDALLALETKIAEKREGDETSALIDQYGIERAVEKLSAYIEQEAAAHSTQLGAGASAASAPKPPVYDPRDDRNDIV